MELSPFLFGLYKFVKFGVYPLTWIAALSGMTFLLAWLPASPARQRWLRITTATAVMLLLIVTSPLVAHLLMGTLEGHQLPTALPTPIATGTIVVLGGGILDSGTLRPGIELTEESMRRTACGAELYRQGIAPTLLMTGGDARVFGSGPAEAAIMKEWAIRIGVPSNSILTEDRARTTYENAIRTKHLLGDRTTIVLVTSAAHIPRATALFHAQGFDIIPFPCGFHEQHRATAGWDALSIFDVLPATWALREISEAVEELAGIALYRLAGKL